MKKKWTAALAVLLTLLMLTGAAAGRNRSRPASAPASSATADNGERVCLPILMYHEVKRSRTGKDCITPAELEGDLAFLKRSGYTTVTMTDLIQYADGKAPLPAKPIVLSFDDGYLSTYRYAYPLVRKYDMKMVLSIIGKSADDFTEAPSDNIDCSHATWEQIREMLASGYVEIQNHTYNLHHITRKRFGCQKKRSESSTGYEKVLTDDLDRMQQEVYIMTGVRPNTFTYPYGKVSPESVPVLKRLGFRASLTCDYGLNLIGRDPQALYGLRRICRPHGSSAQKMLKEAQKTLKYRK